MLKEYWYVLIPVHMVTSVFWFGGFYYAAKSGLDIVPFLEYINIPDKFINPLRNSSLGHIAVASALYKLATPARYMVTLGGTTFAVKFLTKRGLLRP
ncbi:Protein FAM210A, partial [Stegodyphus mimosarum]